MVLGLGKAVNFITRRKRGEPQSGSAGLPSTLQEAELRKAQVHAVGKRRSQAARTAADQERWEEETLQRNLKALETPDPNWQPPDVEPRFRPLTQREKHARDYVYQMTKDNIWYYRDRLSVPRGPCNMWVLRNCWSNGVVDENTLVWGQGLADWLPMKNVRMLIPQIRTPEVRFATFLKKHLSLKPHLHALRMQTGRPMTARSQIDNMF